MVYFLVGKRPRWWFSTDLCILMSVNKQTANNIIGLFSIDLLKKSPDIVEHMFSQTSLEQFFSEDQIKNLRLE